MTHTKPLFLTLGLVMLWQVATCQFYKNQGYWKKDRLELIGGLGAANFLGELGGRDRVGSDFIWDLETKQFKPAMTFGLRYTTSKSTKIRAQISYSVLAGDDALTTEKFRSNRNINFRSRSWEAAGIFEVILRKVRPGHQYNLTGLKGQKPRAANFYAFAGLGILKYNPQGFLDNEWYDLQPLGTEGQNFSDGADPYSLYSLVIPMGIGYRWRTINDNIMMGIEIGHRLTFSDYIDDVSTVYYDPAQLGNQPGFTEFDNLLAQYFGDPSLGYYIDEEGTQVALPGATNPGEQRGDSEDNDAYLFAQVTMSYKIAKRVYRKKVSLKKKGRKVVF